MEYQENPDKYRNMMAKKWTQTNYRGGSRLPKIVTKDHMKFHIHDLMVLLHQIKGSLDVLLFEDWMYRYVEIILEGKQVLDWAELVARSMRN